jgi:hypothetical protein
MTLDFGILSTSVINDTTVEMVHQSCLKGRLSGRPVKIVTLGRGSSAVELLATRRPADEAETRWVGLLGGEQ